MYPQAGRGGGWQLVGGARTDLSGLSASEARALFLLVGPAASIAPEAKAALRKLVRALPDTFRADAQAAADAVVIDAARWGERDRRRPALVDALQGAVVLRRKVRLVYEGRTRSEREVDPLGLVDKDDIWYLIAGTERGRRTFRVDRIVEAEVLAVPAERPEDFDLGAAWEEVVEVVERKRSLLSATVLIEERFVRILRDHFGRHCERLGAEGGRARVRVAAPTAVDIARTLAGWGTQVEVVEPGSVRVELARIGAELAAHYAVSGEPRAEG